jgi:hypothetical protein
VSFSVVQAAKGDLAGLVDGVVGGAAGAVRAEVDDEHGVVRRHPGRLLEIAVAVEVEGGDLACRELDAVAVDVDDDRAEERRNAVNDRANEGSDGVGETAPDRLHGVDHVPERVRSGRADRTPCPLGRGGDVARDVAGDFGKGAEHGLPLLDGKRFGVAPRMGLEVRRKARDGSIDGLDARLVDALDGEVDRLQGIAVAETSEFGADVHRNGRSRRIAVRAKYLVGGTLELFVRPLDRRLKNKLRNIVWDIGQGLLAHSRTRPVRAERIN